ncbi:MAG: type II secretion system GspH family protein [Clostridia bacterium]|nr:type II secretion system GspH family protein [Clostridia bacterium]
MKNKKGFTIVELVIVIAVIAILAAVLIPTFSGVVANANASAALQTARSTLSNALNMSSTASLAGETTAKVAKTVFIVEGYAFNYKGNALEAMTFPGEDSSSKLNGSKAATAKAEDTTNNFNALMVATENVLTGTEGKYLDAAISTYIVKASNITAETDGTITVTSVTIDGVEHMYVGYVEASGDTAATWIAEVFVNSDFSKKAAVFTTFG